MKSYLHFALIVFFICSLLFNSLVLTSVAVYEGSANANTMIRYYEHKEQFGKAALWQEAAAKCLDVISVPLEKITMEYYKRNSNMELVEESESKITDIKKKRSEYLQRAKLNWKKTRESKEELDAERAKINKFIAEWVRHYPPQFYEFGIYRNLFRNRIDELKEQGKFDKALLLEADASDMCARQYEDVTINYFQDKAKEAKRAGDQSLLQQSRRQAKKYQKVRDKHLKRSAMLRALAKQNPEDWPAEADKKDFDVPQSKHKLTPDKAIKLTKADKRIQQILKKHRNVREFAWFQGFCWTVSYYTHSWKDLCVVFVDDETGKVTDVLFSPGNLELFSQDNLEERGFDEEEKERRQKLRLSPEKVIEIAKSHPEVIEYFQIHPKAKAYANYSWQYNCWIVEVVLNNREVGIVSISDRTEKILEITLGFKK